MLIAACAFVVMVIVNVAAFILFGVDKQLARDGTRRVPESTLLFVAFVGGSAGAIAGQQYWRHKTRKEPFRSMLFAIAAFQGVALLWILLVR